jgi:1,4-dihydroxy-2-naphthoate octaprenyltransferase
VTSAYTPAQENPTAKRAMIYGFIALALSLVTLISLIGMVGIAIGTVAMLDGCIGLTYAEQPSKRRKRGQAISGIALGIAAWFVVIFLLILRQALHIGWT